MTKYYSQRRKLEKIYNDAHANADALDRVPIINIVNNPVYLFRKMTNIVLVPRQNMWNAPVHVVQRIEKITAPEISMFKVEKIEYPFDITSNFKEHINFQHNYYWRQVKEKVFDFHIFLYSNQFFYSQVEVNLHYLSERFYNELQLSKK